MDQHVTGCAASVQLLSMQANKRLLAAPGSVPQMMPHHCMLKTSGCSYSKNNDDFAAGTLRCHVALENHAGADAGIIVDAAGLAGASTNADVNADANSDAIGGAAMDTEYCCSGAAVDSDSDSDSGSDILKKTRKRKHSTKRIIGDSDGDYESEGDGGADASHRYGSDSSDDECSICLADIITRGRASQKNKASKQKAGELDSEIEQHYYKHSAEQDCYEKHTTFIAQFLLDDPEDQGSPAFDIFRVDCFSAAIGDKWKNITVTHFIESASGTYLEGEQLGSTGDADAGAFLQGGR